MLSSIPQLLTLAAFTVHAVLGCCWHHAHSVSDGGCQHPAGQAVVACGAGGESHTHGASHCHVDPQTYQKPANSVSANSPRTADVADAGYSGAPSEHSHDCDGAHCTYVRIDSASVPAAATQPLNWLAGFDFRLAMPSAAGAQAGNRWAYQAAVPIYTAPQACALLQTWQI